VEAAGLPSSRATHMPRTDGLDEHRTRTPHGRAGVLRRRQVSISCARVVREFCIITGCRAVRCAHAVRPLCSSQ
jgi:hypothetical protein